ncbi:MAG: M1 family aminopeptidase [Ornithinimicrobium sp.]
MSIVMDEDLGGAQGSQVIEFTPDERACEVVLRTWPNEPSTASDGTSLEVTRAQVAGEPVTLDVSQAGAPERAPGTLVELPLPQCLEAGERVEIDLDFSLMLGRTDQERLGVDPDADIAWFAGGLPVLAWVRDQGWVRDDAVSLAGETATTEDFELASMTVTAPEEYAVMGTGSSSGRVAADRSGWTEHRFEAPAVRNIAVSVGRFDVRTTQADGVRIRVAVPAEGTVVGGREWLDAHVKYLKRLEELLGPYPYDDLWVTVTPTRMSGIESPTALFYGDVRRRTLDGLVAHELAHQWFYSLVGNNQARDPWIDESFATFAQAVATGTEDSFELDEVDADVAGYLGYPMEYWNRQGGFNDYYAGIYDQGAAALLAAREASGEDRFDAALLAYLRQNAHQVSDPDDVETAFEDLPEAVDVLREYGAFDGPPTSFPFG